MLDSLAWGAKAPGYQRCLVSNRLCSHKGNRFVNVNLGLFSHILSNLCLSVAWDDSKDSGTLQRGKRIVLQSVLAAIGSTGLG